MKSIKKGTHFYVRLWHHPFYDQLISTLGSLKKKKILQVIDLVTKKRPLYFHKLDCFI